jgi:hypothetical protein
MNSTTGRIVHYDTAWKAEGMPQTKSYKTSHSNQSSMKQDEQLTACHRVAGGHVWRKGPLRMRRQRPRPMRRLWRSIRREEGRGGQCEVCGTDKVSPFQGTVGWASASSIESTSILSSYKWEASMPVSGRSCLPCSCFWNGVQSVLLLLRSNLSVVSSFPE